MIPIRKCLRSKKRIPESAMLCGAEWRLPGACLLSAGKLNSLRHQGGACFHPRRLSVFEASLGPSFLARSSVPASRARPAQPQLLIRATCGACKNSNVKSTPRPVPPGLAGGLGSGSFESSLGDHNTQPQVGTA